MANAYTTVIESNNDFFGVFYKDESGQEISLDTSGNRLTALHFWATWCIPCVKELPKVNEAQRRYRNLGLKIVAVSMDGSRSDKVRKFYQDNRIDSLDVLLDTDQSALKHFKVKGLPTTIFITPEGKEVKRILGDLDWENGEIPSFIRSQTSR